MNDQTTLEFDCETNKVHKFVVHLKKFKEAEAKGKEAVAIAKKADIQAPRWPRYRCRRMAST